MLINEHQVSMFFMTKYKNRSEVKVPGPDYVLSDALRC